MRTIDGGNNWTPAEVPYTQGSFLDIDFVDELHGWIFASTGYSSELLKTTNGGVTFIEEEATNLAPPKQFLLQQNYPNPFKPRTNINYQSPKTRNATLNVSDVLEKKDLIMVA